MTVDLNVAQLAQMAGIPRPKAQIAVLSLIQRLADVRFQSLCSSTIRTRQALVVNSSSCDCLSPAHLLGGQADGAGPPGGGNLSRQPDCGVPV